MDFLRSVLLVGLVVMVWKFRYRGTRPIKEFLLWGVHYPLPFGLFLFMTLIVWGLIGKEFGLYTLFFEDNGFIQALLGAATVLLFQGLLFHFLALDGTKSRWSSTVRTTLDVFLQLRFLGRKQPWAVLRNGFLEDLSRRDMKRIERAINVQDAALDAGTVKHLKVIRSKLLIGDPDDLDLRDMMFRLMFAPAALLVSSIMIYAILVVVPVFGIPLLNGKPRLIVERLPWLLGGSVGVVVGIEIACLTTWLLSQTPRLKEAVASVKKLIKGEVETQAGAGEVGRRPAAVPEVISKADLKSSAGGADGTGKVRMIRGGGRADRKRSLRQRFSAGISPFLLVFFVIHGVAQLRGPSVLRMAETKESVGYEAWLTRVLGEVSAESYTGQLRDVMVQNASAIRAALVLGVEFLTAALVFFVLVPAIWKLNRRWVLGVFAHVVAWAGRLASWLSHWWSSLGIVLVSFVMFFMLFGGAFLLEPSQRIAAETSTGSLPMQAGIAGATLLAIFMLCWLLSFTVATLVTFPDKRTGQAGAKGASSPLFWVGVGCGFFLLSVMFWINDAYGRSMLSSSPSLLIGLVLVQPSLEGWKERRLLVAIGTGLLLGFGLLFAYSLFNQAPVASESPMRFLSSASLMLAVVLLTTPLLAYIIQFENATIVFSLSAVMAWCGFAMFFNGLREEAQAWMPAGASLLFLVGLIGSLSTSITFAWPRRSGAVFLGILGIVIIVNGNSWNTVENRYKLKFPGLDGYYRQPVYLDTRAYYRETARTGYKLRSKKMADQIRTLQNENETQRLAMLYFDPDEVKIALDEQGQAKHVRLTLQDERKSFSPRVGDGVRFYQIDVANKREEGTSPLNQPISGLVKACDHDSSGSFLVVTIEVPESPRLLKELGLGALEVGSEEHKKKVEDWLSTRGVKLENTSILLSKQQLDEGLPESARPFVKPGDTIMVQDHTSETPITLAEYMFLDDASGRAGAGISKNLVVYSEALRREAQRHAQTLVPDSSKQPFLLRMDQNRGLFEKVGEIDSEKKGTSVLDWSVELANGERLVVGQRLILLWTDHPESPEYKGGGLFEVGEPGKWTKIEGTSVFRNARLKQIWVTGQEKPVAGRPLVGKWMRLNRLDNYEVLEAWKKTMAGLWADGAPPMVLLTVSGGGIRSSVWSATVLKKLEERLGNRFPYHVRMVTGASGGMVGSSLYVTTLRPPDALRPSAESAHTVPMQEVVRWTQEDQLNAVAGRLAFADIPSLLNPLSMDEDRGRTLELTWARLSRSEGGEADGSPLDRSFRWNMPSEALGWLPSLVYTPMMIEDGRRLIVSNLNLQFISRNVGGLLVEPESKKVTADEDDQSVEIDNDLYSLSSLEFYGLFPDAWDFKTSTAIRMSASFPFVSPAVSLPTNPPRRVVDAGYYDNYGVNLSSLWLAEVSPWLIRNTSGVVVIQIRDFVSQTSRTDLGYDRFQEGNGSGLARVLDQLTLHSGYHLLSSGIQPITSPLVGISAARQWTMSFRNDEQVEYLDEMFAREIDRTKLHSEQLGQMKDSRFFETVVFECPVEASLNWKLNQDEQELISLGFGAKGEVPDLIDYLEEGAARERIGSLQTRHPDKSAVWVRAEKKRLYDVELTKLGFSHTRELQAQQSEMLYRNVMNNRKRMKLLEDWWQERRESVSNDLTGP